MTLQPQMSNNKTRKEMENFFTDIRPAAYDNRLYLRAGFVRRIP